MKLNSNFINLTDYDHNRLEQIRRHANSEYQLASDSMISTGTFEMNDIVWLINFIDWLVVGQPEPEPQLVVLVENDDEKI